MTIENTKRRTEILPYTTEAAELACYRVLDETEELFERHFVEEARASYEKIAQLLIDADRAGASSTVIDRIKRRYIALGLKIYPDMD